MTCSVDLLVVGAGPAGTAAASVAASHGVETAIVDEGRGDLLWFAAPGFRAHSIGPAGKQAWQAKAVLAATGAVEQIVPFPGWTTPGVIALTEHPGPGRRVVVAGGGPHLAAHAAAIRQGGSEVVAIIDRSATATLPQEVIGVVGDTRVEGVVVRPIGDHGQQSVLTADTLAIGHGRAPCTELTRLLGATHRYDADRGGWAPLHDQDFRTATPLLYVAGDAAGIVAAAAAALQGQIAGLTACRDLGRITAAAHAEKTAVLRRELERAPNPDEVLPACLATVTPDTIVCRCEAVTRRQIEAAIEGGARTLNQLKTWNRCGMGPCQGRLCAATAAGLIAPHAGGRAAVGQWTARVPLRPVSLAALAGEFDYDAIRAAAPIPQPL